MDKVVPSGLIFGVLDIALANRFPKLFELNIDKKSCCQRMWLLWLSRMDLEEEH